MTNLTSAQIERLTEAYPRGWIVHYWEELCMVAPQLSFEEKKEAFFYLLERLLKEGKVRFENPFARDPVYWEGASPEEIIKHLKAGWPQSATTEGDEAIVDYFYDHPRCPPIDWLGEDGEWY